MKELIKKKVLARNWTFNEIANINSTITLICNELSEELTLMEKFNLANEVRINESYVGMELYHVLGDIVYTSLEVLAAETIKELLLPGEASVPPTCIVKAVRFPSKLLDISSISLF